MKWKSRYQKCVYQIFRNAENKAVPDENKAVPGKNKTIYLPGKVDIFLDLI